MHNNVTIRPSRNIFNFVSGNLASSAAFAQLAYQLCFNLMNGEGYLSTPAFYIYVGLAPPKVAALSIIFFSRSRQSRA